VLDSASIFICSSLIFQKLITAWHCKGVVIRYIIFFSSTDVNIVGECIDTINKIREALLDGSKEVCLEVNPEKTKYMLMSHGKAGQKHNISSKYFL
jgi:hypothetical protein